MEAVNCLRCSTQLQKYAFTIPKIEPDGYSRIYVTLECPTCGHVEFVTKDSALIKGLSVVVPYWHDDD